MENQLQIGMISQEHDQDDKPNSSDHEKYVVHCLTDMESVQINIVMPIGCIYVFILKMFVVENDHIKHMQQYWYVDA